MGWRDKMGGGVAIKKPGTLEQKEQKAQKVDDRGAFATSATIAHRFENEKGGSPIPMDEKEFAQDERKAIQDFDGGQDYLIQRVTEIFNGTVIPQKGEN